MRPRLRPSRLLSVSPAPVREGQVDVPKMRQAWRSLDAQQQAWAQAMARGVGCETLRLSEGLSAFAARARREAIFQQLHVGSVLALRCVLLAIGVLP